MILELIHKDRKTRRKDVNKICWKKYGYVLSTLDPREKTQKVSLAIHIYLT